MIVFFNDTATTEIYTYCHTLSLHDALPISVLQGTEDHHLRPRPGDEPGHQRGPAERRTDPDGGGYGGGGLRGGRLHTRDRHVHLPARHRAHADRKSTRLNSSH